MSLIKNKCSCWFDGWFRKSWADACRLHDERYMTPLGKDMTRLECDLELMRNVAKVCKLMSYVMFVVVRIAGWYWWNLFERARNGI